MEHKLKILPQYFKAVKEGTKTFELRENDRGFKVGDKLVLQEYELFKNISVEGNYGLYTGNEIEKEISYIYEGTEYGLKEGWCILGLKDIEENITGRIKALVRPDGFNIFDDEGFICGTLGVNKEKLKALLHKVNDNIHLKNIDLSGISKQEQLNKVREELREFTDSICDYMVEVTEGNKLHAIEEYFDLLQSALGLLDKFGIPAEEVQAYYPKHLEKIKNRPRHKEE